MGGVYAEFGDVQKGTPTRRIDGNPAFHVGGKHGLPRDLAPLAYADDAHAFDIFSGFQISERIQRHVRPFKPRSLVGLHAPVEVV